MPFFYFILLSEMIFRVTLIPETRGEGSQNFIVSVCRLSSFCRLSSVRNYGSLLLLNYWVLSDETGTIETSLRAAFGSLF